MAEIVPTYVIHNMFRAQSSHEQRARAAVPHSAVEWLAGRRILPKKPIRISKDTFDKYEVEIIQKVREGRFGVTCPDLTFIDSRPDGRLFITYLNKKTDEEPLSDLKSESKEPVLWPCGHRVDGKGPRHFNASVEGPTGPVGTDCGPESIGPTGEIGEPGVIGPTDYAIPGDPEVSDPPVEPVSETEITKELEDPNEDLLSQTAPVDANSITTLDAPRKKRKKGDQNG
jgi:hypothetical protein